MTEAPTGAGSGKEFCSGLLFTPSCQADVEKAVMNPLCFKLPALGLAIFMDSILVHGEKRDEAILYNC